MEHRGRHGTVREQAGGGGGVVKDSEKLGQLLGKWKGKLRQEMKQGQPVQQLAASLATQSLSSPTRKTGSKGFLPLLPNQAILVQERVGEEGFFFLVCLCISG